MIQNHQRNPPEDRIYNTSTVIQTKHEHRLSRIGGLATLQSEINDVMIGKHLRVHGDVPHSRYSRMQVIMI